MEIKKQLEKWSNREKIIKNTKLKPTPEANHLVNYKKEKEYDYYLCDYCGGEIVIKKKRLEMDGGLVILPYTLTKNGDIKVVLHNRCLNPLVRQIENGGDKH